MGFLQGHHVWAYGREHFRRALALSGGSYDFLYGRPITAAFLAIALVSLLYPLLRGALKSRRQARAALAH